MPALPFVGGCSGFILFDQIPELYTVLGAAIIIGSAFYIRAAVKPGPGRVSRLTPKAARPV